MSLSISFFVPGIPKPAGSKRAFVIKGRAIITEANPKAKDWKADVRAACTYEGAPLNVPLSMYLTFTMPRPKSHYGSGRNAEVLKPSAPVHPTSKPDCTKLTRGTEDALTSIIWKDDSQIVIQRIVKRYGDTPGCLVEITEPQYP